jgi:hypothetical protein
VVVGELPHGLRQRRPDPAVPADVLYTVCVVWLLWIAKWHELVDVGHIAAILPFILLLYTGVCFFSNWTVRSRWMVMYPYYALFQALVMPSLTPQSPHRRQRVAAPVGPDPRSVCRAVSRYVDPIA